MGCTDSKPVGTPAGRRPTKAPARKPTTTPSSKQVTSPDASKATVASPNNMASPHNMASPNNMSSSANSETGGMTSHQESSSHPNEDSEPLNQSEDEPLSSFGGSPAADTVVGTPHNADLHPPAIFCTVHTTNGTDKSSLSINDTELGDQPEICIIAPEDDDELGNTMRTVNLEDTLKGGFASAVEDLTDSPVYAPFAALDAMLYEDALKGFQEVMSAVDVQSREYVVCALGVSVLRTLFTVAASSDIPSNPEFVRRAKRWICRLSKTGSPSALMCLSEYARAGGEETRELLYRERAAETGHPLAVLRHAAANLADLKHALSGGAISRRVHDKCGRLVFDNLLHLAEQNSVIGYKAAKTAWPMYYLGEGVKKDLKVARHLLQRAIELEENEVAADKLRGKLAKVGAKIREEAALGDGVATGGQWRRGSSAVEALSRTYSDPSTSQHRMMSRNSQERAAILQMMPSGHQQLARNSSQASLRAASHSRRRGSSHSDEGLRPMTRRGSAASVGVRRSASVRSMARTSSMSSRREAVRGQSF